MANTVTSTPLPSTASLRDGIVAHPSLSRKGSQAARNAEEFCLAPWVKVRDRIVSQLYCPITTCIPFRTPIITLARDPPRSGALKLAVDFESTERIQKPDESRSEVW